MIGLPDVGSRQDEYMQEYWRDYPQHQYTSTPVVKKKTENRCMTQVKQKVPSDLKTKQSEPENEHDHIVWDQTGTMGKDARQEFRNQ